MKKEIDVVMVNMEVEILKIGKMHLYINVSFVTLILKEVGIKRICNGRPYIFVIYFAN